MLKPTLTDSKGDNFIRDIWKNLLPASKRIQTIDTRIAGTVNYSAIYGKFVYDDPRSRSIGEHTPMVTRL